MDNMIGKLIDRYPKLPALLAETSASKLIQLIKKNVLDPALGNEQVVQKIQSWPTAIKKTAEWVPYFLSSMVRIMPEPSHPVAIMLQATLAESLTQVGMKANEIAAMSPAERREIIEAVLPLVKDQLVQEERKDSGFKKALLVIGAGAKEFTTEAGSRMSKYRKTLRDKRLGDK